MMFDGTLVVQCKVQEKCPKKKRGLEKSFKPLLDYGTKPVFLSIFSSIFIYHVAT